MDKVDKNDQWLIAYAGRWVALRHGELIAEASALHDLIDLIGDQPESERPLVLKVPGKVDGVALVSSIFELLAAREDADPSLVHAIAVLRDIVTDWQVIYHSLENQLELALVTNAALVAQVAGLRNNLDAAREMYYRAEKRVLDG